MGVIGGYSHPFVCWPRGKHLLLAGDGFEEGDSLVMVAVG